MSARRRLSASRSRRRRKKREETPEEREEKLARLRRGGGTSLKAKIVWGIVGVLVVVGLVVVYPMMRIRSDIRMITSQHATDAQKTEAARDLASFGRRAEAALVEVASTGDDEAGGYAAMALGMMKASKAAERLMKSDRALTRVNAVRVYGWINDVEARDAVIAALSDPDPAVRKEACRWVATDRIKRAFPEVTELLTDKDFEVRKAACNALKYITTPAAVPKVIKAAADNDDPTTREAIVDVLVSEELKDVRDMLLSTVKANCLGADVESAKVYLMIAKKMLAYGGDKVIQMMLRHPSPEIQAEAVGMVASLGGKGVYKMLIDLVCNGDAGVAVAAAKALKKIQWRDEEGEKRLASLCSRPEEFRRYAALTGLVSGGTARSVPAALKCLRDKSLRVSDAALEVLKAAARRSYGVVPTIAGRDVEMWKGWFDRARREFEQLERLEEKMKELDAMKRAGRHEEVFDGCRKLEAEFNKLKQSVMIAPMKRIESDLHKLQVIKFGAMKGSVVR